MKCRNIFIQSQLERMGWVAGGGKGTYITYVGELREYVVLTRPAGVSRKMEGKIFQLLAKAESRRRGGADPQPLVEQAKALLS